MNLLAVINLTLAFDVVKGVINSEQAEQIAAELHVQLSSLMISTPHTQIIGIVHRAYQNAGVTFGEDVQ
jgi:hypothetical protein